MNQSDKLLPIFTCLPIFTHFCIFTPSCLYFVPLKKSPMDQKRNSEKLWPIFIYPHNKFYSSVVIPVIELAIKCNEVTATPRGCLIPFRDVGLHINSLHTIFELSISTQKKYYRTIQFLQVEHGDAKHQVYLFVGGKISSFLHSLNLLPFIVFAN